METTASDTRARILQVALDLFIEQGYEKTSLREIAERLGVTKAALYYHFKSKEDLIDGVLNDRLAHMDAMAEWLRTRPRTAATRREFVQRYAEDLHAGQYQKVMRLFESNQAAMKNMPAGHRMREKFLILIDAMVDRHESLADQLRAALSIWALHTSWFILGADVTDEERRAAALEVALELVSQSPSPVAR